ncbi:MAG: molybdopterin-dependent oxidoreductase, partial [Methylococcales bacterium]|nr:molybdopterin-dependent oxidoreductase [Methylococcales bacterium]
MNVINFFAMDCLMPVDKQLVVDTQGMVDLLAEIAVELTIETKVAIPPTWEKLLKGVKPTPEAEALAGQLIRAARATLFVGALVDHHPQAATIRALVRFIASLSNNYIVILPTANDNGLTLAGAIPYLTEQKGLNTDAMMAQSLRAYLLLGTEPELDCAHQSEALDSLNQADFVVTLNCFMTDAMRDYANVILPIASFAETSGTYVNVDQQWQSFTGAVSPVGESRPAWKVLRVLGNLAEVDGFDFVSSEDVRDAVQTDIENTAAVVKETFVPATLKMPKMTKSDLIWIAEVPSYQIDSLTRRSDALQATPENQHANIARMNTAEATRQGVEKSERIAVTQGAASVTVAFELDDAIADGCLYLAG